MKEKLFSLKREVIYLAWLKYYQKLNRLPMKIQANWQIVCVLPCCLLSHLISSHLTSSHLISSFFPYHSYIFLTGKEKENEKYFLFPVPSLFLYKKISNTAFHLTGMIKRQKHLSCHLCSSSLGLCRDRVYSLVYWDVGPMLSHAVFPYWQMLFGSRKRHGKDLLFKWITMESLELCILQTIKI